MPCCSLYTVVLFVFFVVVLFFKLALGIIKLTCRASEHRTIGINRDIKRVNSYENVSVALCMLFK